MRLRQHLTEGRTKELYADQAIEGIKNNCKKALAAYQKGIRIYRGAYDSSNFGYIEPAKHTRVSANTDNLYTLMIDNDPRWSKFPKRSKSIICSNKVYGASPYGNISVVFPVDSKQNFGIAPENDLWGSFTKSNISTLEEFNSNLIYGLGDSTLGIRPHYDNIKGVKMWMAKMDKAIKDKDMSEDELVADYRTFMKGYKGDLYKHVQSLLDPRKNRFGQTNDIMKLPREDGHDHEIWTDTPSYMIGEIWLRSNADSLFG